MLINKIKEEAKAVVSKIKNNIEKREEYREKTQSRLNQSNGEAAVVKDCQVVVKDLFQKDEEAIKKVGKNPIDDHYKEGFELELWNEEIESITQRTLNELGVVQEMKMKER